MKASRYIDQDSAPPGTLQLAAALLSFLVILTRGTKRAPEARPQVQQPAEKLAAAAQKKSAEVASLRSESKPKALFHIAISAAK